ncbi:MAG TPA: hypothetical protein VLB01_01790 [Thermodesulfobacteriota bacterium]|nr:hypothetical protein [Thermodesulfobacteriota bacterium]
MTEKKRVCMICGRLSEVSICDACKASVQGEVQERKQRVEKEVRVGQEAEIEKRKKKGSD